MESLKLVPKYLFGKNSILGLEEELKNHKYNKALILTGKNSYRLNNAFEELIKILRNLDLSHIHFDSIEPNPRDITIDRCVAIAKNNGVDVIFALGGGSVVDASKVISTLIRNPDINTCWEYVLKKSKTPEKGIDIISIITLAGTGSENNGTSVISNWSRKEKKSVYNPNSAPIISVQDPTYTFTVDPWNTASGIFDSFSHLLEQYFGKSTFEWTKEFIFANLKVLIKYAKMSILRPNHYVARANIFWTTTMALNGLASFNCETDWSVHTIEHAMSGLWDITHGAGLAFITPTYLKVRSQKEKWFKDKVIELGRNVFKTQTFETTIMFLENFIKSINLPIRWSEFDKIIKFDNQDAEFLLSHTLKFGEPKLKEIYKDVIWTLKGIK